MSIHRDYKSSPRQRRRSVRRHGLLVITLILVGLLGGLLTYIKRGTQETPATIAAPVVPATPATPVTRPVRAVTVPEPVTPEPSKPKYDFYTELPKRQVGIQ